jgi:hypothetical protein
VRKRLCATRITNRLAHISRNDFYCVEYHEGKSGFLETRHCPYFEGRTNHASIQQQRGHCHCLGVTETPFTHPLALLWDEVKHPDCPETPDFIKPT